MSMQEALVRRDHNKPPVIAPTDTELFADLQNRYPEVPTELAEFEKALATYPEKLTLKDEDTAAALQDLLGKMKKQQSVWKAHRGTEKRPWDVLVKVAQNFFGKAEEKVDGWLDTWKPRHQAFLDLKAAENRRKADEEAERQRQEADRLRKEAEAAEQRKAEAERAEREAREAEEAARKRAEEATERQRIADENAAKAKAEEKRIADEKRERERAEREQNAVSLKELKRLVKEADKLDLLATAEEISDEETITLSELLRPGGGIAKAGGPLLATQLLADDQKADLEEIRDRVNALRQAFGARADAKERRRRKKEQDEHDAREKAAAEERAKARALDEARTAEAKAAREKAEREAEEAKATAKTAKGEVRDARAAGRDAIADQKDAAKEGKRLSTDADRASNRADRMERKVENSTDADHSRTRGDLGTTGSLTGRWVHEIIDENALRAVCGPLGEHFTEDALSGAAYRWMAAHREGFTGERVEGRLPGVVFIWERSSMIRP